MGGFFGSGATTLLLEYGDIYFCFIPPAVTAITLGVITWFMDPSVEREVHD